ncbi:hypothetical protein ETAA8_70250 [Anatilimnocola aggregata]|uniref:Uncharacterized protein n=1 Tax=Anatilimnocola aggregata TaxID=2528021 RepID=A0A517YNQ7_9BACT|nr:hypothetical protein [Anatilimnocola aggregata]QDU31864.1 hypothetical protein ETAA8_70250 [Anatilimnocola aggregata]
MNEFTVQTGNLKITILAESALDAAMEAVQVWEAVSLEESSLKETKPAKMDATHRANLDPLTIVRRANRRGAERRYPTFNLLAYSHQESPATAWQRVLSGRVSIN